jgi:hypothetical protein
MTITAPYVLTVFIMGLTISYEEVVVDSASHTISVRYDRTAETRLAELNDFELRAVTASIEAADLAHTRGPYFSELYDQDRFRAVLVTGDTTYDTTWETHSKAPDALVALGESLRVLAKHKVPRAGA